MDLHATFPTIVAKCQAHRAQFRPADPQIVERKGIIYDQSVIPSLTDDQIDCFVDLQLAYPDLLNTCFHYINEYIAENETGYKKFDNTPLRILLQDKNVNVDKWILFIKSQNVFSYYLCVWFNN